MWYFKAPVEKVPSCINHMLPIRVKLGRNSMGIWNKFENPSVKHVVQSFSLACQEKKMMEKCVVGIHSHVLNFGLLCSWLHPGIKVRQIASLSPYPSAVGSPTEQGSLSKGRSGCFLWFLGKGVKAISTYLPVVHMT